MIQPRQFNIVVSGSVDVNVNVAVTFDHNALGAKLRAATESLSQAVASASEPSLKSLSGVSLMANPIIDPLVADVTDAVGVMASATTLINGFSAKLQAAIQAAFAGGATAAELAPLTDLDAQLQANKAALSAAVAANQ